MIQTLTVTLAGNPNVGKSTLFNRLTGMRQHTGNWPGKTVGTAQGRLRTGGVEYVITDLGREMLAKELQRLEELVQNGKRLMGGTEQ